MILEGNLFILDKRVNLLKKDSRDNTVSRNLQKASQNMNEVFGGQEQCSTTCCFVSDNRCEPVNKIEEIEEIVDNIGREPEIQFIEPLQTQQASHPQEVQDTVDTEITPENIISIVDASFNVGNVGNVDNSAIVEENNDAMSVTSEITFNTDKYSQKKLSKLNIDKLKEICATLNVNSEGTKAQLISKILDNK